MWCNSYVFSRESFERSWNNVNICECCQSCFAVTLCIFLSALCAVLGSSWISGNSLMEATFVAAGCAQPFFAAPGAVCLLPGLTQENKSQPTLASTSQRSVKVCVLLWQKLLIKGNCSDNLMPCYFESFVWSVLWMLCMQTTRYIFKTKFKIILLTVCSQKLVLLLLMLMPSARI